MLDQAHETDPCLDHAEIVAERYRLGPVLRRSSMCCAHRAYDELLQRTVRVTLVVADPAASGSFSLRPQSWLDRDPELAELYDAGSDGDRRFLVTHHPDEPTLAETTPPGGLDLAQLRDLGTSIATTLLPRHRRGAAHGGLGAGTVAFGPQGTSLAEFGLLPWLARWQDVPVMPPFPAPEQRTGTPTGPASDVYALGRLLGEFAPPDGLRPEMADLLTDMTAESPSARPSLEEVLGRLAERDATPATPAIPATPAPVVIRTPGRYRRAGLVAAACCLVGLGVGLSGLAGATSSLDAAGATLSATAAAPAPVLPPAPLPAAPAPAASSVLGDAVAAAVSGNAAGPTATAVAASAPTAAPATTDASTVASATTGATTSAEPAPRDVDSAAPTTTASQDRGGSSADPTGQPSSSSTPETDAPSIPSGSAQPTGSPDHGTTGSGHQGDGGSGSASGQKPDRSGKDGGSASDGDHGSSPAKKHSLLGDALTDAVTDS